MRIDSELQLLSKCEYRVKTRFHRDRRCSNFVIMFDTFFVNWAIDSYVAFE